MELIKTKVSVLMPVYNGLPLIKASIESLRQQSYANWECIIVDDGSNDGTSEYLDTLNDVRFVVHHFNENHGRPIARQKSLELASGEFIALLDAGDLYHPNKLNLQVKLLTQNSGIALVGSRICSFGTSCNKLYVRGRATSTPVVFSGQDVPCHATCLLRTEIAKKISYNPKLKLGEDVDFLERYMKDKRYVVLNEVLYYYSELDSVNKLKISQSYYIYAKKYIRELELKKAALFSLKYLYSKLIFPFISIDDILSRRGQIADKHTEDEFKRYCSKIINLTSARRKM